MEMLNTVKAVLLALDPQQTLLAGCLLRVIMMLMALMLLHRRTKQAE